MRTLTGRYELEDDVARFFGARTLKFVSRHLDVTGRFGRDGVIRGRFVEGQLQAEWHDRERKGWLKIRFTPLYRSGQIEYGLIANTAETGHGSITRVVRSVKADSANHS